MFMILCVVDDPHKVNGVMEAWRNAGVAGMTIVESTGLHRVQKVPHIPMPYLLGGVESERGNITILTVVEDEAMIQRCLAAAESVVGDFDSSNTGIFTAWPLTFAKGVARKNHMGNA